jgi:hypothetical protein
MKRVQLHAPRGEEHMRQAAEQFVENSTSPITPRAGIAAAIEDSKQLNFNNVRP